MPWISNQKHKIEEKSSKSSQSSSKVAGLGPVDLWEFSTLVFSQCTTSGEDELNAKVITLTAFFSQEAFKLSAVKMTVIYLPVMMRQPVGQPFCFCDTIIADLAWIGELCQNGWNIQKQIRCIH